MDAPPIQYARAADGVNIGYWTLGEGPSLVSGRSWGTNAQTVWEASRNHYPNGFVARLVIWRQ